MKTLLNSLSFLLILFVIISIESKAQQVIDLKADTVFSKMKIDELMAKHISAVDINSSKAFGHKKNKHQEIVIQKWEEVYAKQFEDYYQQYPDATKNNPIKLFAMIFFDKEGNVEWLFYNLIYIDEEYRESFKSYLSNLDLKNFIDLKCKKVFYQCGTKNLRAPIKKS